MWMTTEARHPCGAPWACFTPRSRERVATAAWLRMPLSGTQRSRCARNALRSTYAAGVIFRLALLVISAEISVIRLVLAVRSSRFKLRIWP
jgi:hypothetical protein